MDSKWSTSINSHYNASSTSSSCPPPIHDFFISVSHIAMRGHIVGEMCRLVGAEQSSPRRHGQGACAAQRDLMSYYVNQPMPIIIHDLLLDAIGKKPICFNPFVPVTNARGVGLRVSQECDINYLSLN